MNSLQKFIDDFQINIVKKDLNEFINTYENTSQLIDDQKTIINSIDDIFSWLYHIKELTIEKVAKLIQQSVWVSSKENVQELAACILQVVRTDIFAHSEIIELIISLDHLSSQTENFQILYPFILKYIKSMFHINYHYSAFAYKLYQKKIFTFDEIFKENAYTNMVLNYSGNPENFSINEFNDLHSEERKMHNFNILIWFYPEINELERQIKGFFYVSNNEFEHNPNQSNPKITRLFKDLEKYKQMSFGKNHIC